MAPPVAARIVAASNVAVVAVVVFGVFVALPARWWPVDTAAVLVAASQSASALALLFFVRSRAAVPIAIVGAAVALALGLLALSLLVVTASWLRGVYGPIGRGGAIVLSLTAALAAPYLVALPIAQLAWLRSARPRAAESGD